MTARIETQDRQYGMVQKELKSVTTLVEKGLAVAPRQLVLEPQRIDLDHTAVDAEVELRADARLDVERSRT